MPILPFEYRFNVLVKLLLLIHQLRCKENEQKLEKCSERCVSDISSSVFGFLPC